MYPQLSTTSLLWPIIGVVVWGLIMVIFSCKRQIMRKHAMAIAEGRLPGNHRMSNAEIWKAALCIAPVPWEATNPADNTTHNQAVQPARMSTEMSKTSRAGSASAQQHHAPPAGHFGTNSPAGYAVAAKSDPNTWVIGPAPESDPNAPVGDYGYNGAGYGAPAGQYGHSQGTYSYAQPPSSEYGTAANGYGHAANDYSYGAAAQPPPPMGYGPAEYERTGYGYGAASAQQGSAFDYGHGGNEYGHGRNEHRQ